MSRTMHYVSIIHEAEGRMVYSHKRVLNILIENIFTWETERV